MPSYHALVHNNRVNTAGEFEIQKMFLLILQTGKVRQIQKLKEIDYLSSPKIKAKISYFQAYYFS